MKGKVDRNMREALALVSEAQELLERRCNRPGVSVEDCILFRALGKVDAAKIVLRVAINAVDQA